MGQYIDMYFSWCGGSMQICRYFNTLLLLAPGVTITATETADGHSHALNSSSSRAFQRSTLTLRRYYLSLLVQRFVSLGTLQLGHTA
mmetsp:Transcript_29640/g.86319  ORF Transcript_29640/g.86319 Transcript_29640/m.86319 type:complete len:87 (+) Transcript_29640:1663-1923(+)